MLCILQLVFTPLIVLGKIFAIYNAICQIVRYFQNLLYLLAYGPTISTGLLKLLAGREGANKNNRILNVTTSNVTERAELCIFE